MVPAICAASETWHVRVVLFRFAFQFGRYLFVVGLRFTCILAVPGAPAAPGGFTASTQVDVI